MAAPASIEQLNTLDVQLRKIMNERFEEGDRNILRITTQIAEIQNMPEAATAESTRVTEGGQKTEARFLGLDTRIEGINEVLERIDTEFLCGLRETIPTEINAKIATHAMEDMWPALQEQKKIISEMQAMVQGMRMGSEPGIGRDDRRRELNDPKNVEKPAKWSGKKGEDVRQYELWVKHVYRYLEVFILGIPEILKQVAHKAEPLNATEFASAVNVIGGKYDQKWNNFYDVARELNSFFRNYIVGEAADLIENTEENDLDVETNKFSLLKK